MSIPGLPWWEAKPSYSEHHKPLPTSCQGLPKPGEEMHHQSLQVASSNINIYPVTGWLVMFLVIPQAVEIAFYIVFLRAKVSQ
jgi:hypothetical protein